MIEEPNCENATAATGRARPMPGISATEITWLAALVPTGIVAGVCSEKAAMVVWTVVGVRYAIKLLRPNSH